MSILTDIGEVFAIACVAIGLILMLAGVVDER